MNEFDDYAINIDSDCLHQDFDDIDLYGEKYEEEDSDGYSDNIQFD